MSEGTADPVFTPEEVQGALDKLRKKYGHTREIARTLAWVGHDRGRPSEPIQLRL
jgi:hypothetical protein